MPTVSGVGEIRAVPPSDRDCFLDEMARKLPEAGLIARQYGPGLYVLSDGARFLVTLPDVPGQFSVNGSKSVPRVDLTAPLSSAGDWTFAADSKDGTEVTVRAQTWMRARQGAAVLLGCEPGSLRLVRSPL